MTDSEYSIVVIGSVNLDLVATVERLPCAGETVTGASLNRYPGGKGANQSLAARRLGAKVCLIACVGNDDAAGEATALLRAAGVDLSLCMTDADAPTGVAMIAVAKSGENHIVVAPGANRRLLPERLKLPAADALICQLEVPAETLLRAARDFAGFFCINLAPALEVPQELIARADLVVMNESEADWYGDRVDHCRGFVAITKGSKGAMLRRNGRRIANAEAPKVRAIDTVGAGDSFTAALTLALIEGQDPSAALRFACAAGAAATMKAGAQPSLPDRAAVEHLL
jgi:ribokinase